MGVKDLAFKDHMAGNYVGAEKRLSALPEKELRDMIDNMREVIQLAESIIRVGKYKKPRPV